LIAKPNQNQYLVVGNNIFLIGILLLPSAFALSVIFLFISLVISISQIEIKKKENFSILIFICIILIFLSTVNNTIINKPLGLISYNNSSIWLNLFNWLPLFICTWGFRNYLLDINQRLLFAKYLLAGTIPVLMSCILQLWFGFDNGPYNILNGFIVWFQYPTEKIGALTGLFSNQNITGMWFCITLALALGLIKEEKNKTGKFFLIGIISLIIYFIFLTNSRNAFLGLLITIFLSTGIKKSFLILFSTFSGFYLTNILYLLLNKNNLILFPNLLLKKLTFNYSFFEDRVIIWQEALGFIFKRPLSGWGGSTFSYLFPKNEIGFPAYHTHNILIEIAYSFGIPIAILLTIFLYNLTKKSFKKIIFENKNEIHNIFNQSWFICFVIMVICHTTDMTFFDGRISIVFSILISGLVNLVNKPLKLKS
tara:strand:+ start:70 stop:1341 length:1272 start_codon:yes stop_codon:yes gene_type:complete